MYDLMILMFYSQLVSSKGQLVFGLIQSVQRLYVYIIIWLMF